MLYLAKWKIGSYAKQECNKLGYTHLNSKSDYEITKRKGKEKRASIKPNPLQNQPKC